MYQPKHFIQADTPTIHELMRQYPLAAVVTNGRDGLTADHLPLLLEATASTLGILRGHVARANPLWKNVSQEAEVLVIFQGPDHYISPNAYPDKETNGKVVPTWNYLVAHAHGRVSVHQDEDWLREHLQALTQYHEAQQPKPWAMTQAPEDYLQKMMKAVVGIELKIERLEGKWKASQNQSGERREGVAEMLQNQASDAAQDLAKWVLRSE